MTTQTGSYPLMNLAREFGADYGDVLLLADEHRQARADERTNGRTSAAILAKLRLRMRLGFDEADALMLAIAMHARGRWA